MFSADLSWSDPHTEKVGERRERRARERSTTASSISTSASSKSSVSAERELWWTSGLRKAKGIKPRLSSLRHSRSRSTTLQDTDEELPDKQDTKLAHDLTDPTLQPSWTYSSTLPSRLPSGESLDFAIHEVPELDGDVSSRYTDSTEPRFSRTFASSYSHRSDLNHRTDDRRKETSTSSTMNGTITMTLPQQTSPRSFVTSRTRRSSVATERESYASTSSPHTEDLYTNGLQQVKVVGAMAFDVRSLHDVLPVVDTTADLEPTPFDRVNVQSKFFCRPLSQWESLAPRTVPSAIRSPPPEPIDSKAFITQSSTIESNRFQRFIRRMENAGPRIVLDRLKEEWHGVEGDEELALEKQLWLLTGFHMQSLGKGRMAPRPRCDDGRILELYGNLSEVYQLSAMHPTQMVHFLTTQPRRKIPLPGNVSYLTVRDLGTVPLPYPGNYFSHIRASTLPSLVPSAKLPELFRECYKLLAPGGLLEIRIMDAAPMRKRSGPLMRTWIEDRLSTNLERLFRCSKPCMLVPGWLDDVGFELTTTEDTGNIALPCAFDTSSTNIGQELSTVIGQSMWKEIWGDFVDDAPGESKWWWEDESIVEECLRRQTMFECRTLFAYKR